MEHLPYFHIFKNGGELCLAPVQSFPHTLNCSYVNSAFISNLSYLILPYYCGGRSPLGRIQPSIYIGEINYYSDNIIVMLKLVLMHYCLQYSCTDCFSVQLYSVH